MSAGLSRIILLTKTTFDRLEARNLAMVGRGMQKPLGYEDDRDHVAISISERSYERLMNLSGGELLDPNAAIERLLDGLDALEEVER